MIKPRFTISEVHKAFQKKKEAINTVLIRQLKILGEKCLNEARTKYTYKDDTGNLTSSFGYAIYVGGESIQESFEGRAIGVSKAKQLARNHVLRSSANEILLIVVAGMDYALAVESKGYDVLTPAEQLAEREFPIMMKGIADKIDKAGI